MASLAFDVLAREIENEVALENLIGHLRSAHEVDQMSLTVNGRKITRKEMSDGTFKVDIDGFKTAWNYEACIKWAGGK